MIQNTMETLPWDLSEVDMGPKGVEDVLLA